MENNKSNNTSPSNELKASGDSIPQGLDLAGYCEESNTPEEKQLDISKAIEQVEEDKRLHDIAARILKEGRALDFICNSCSQIHYGDKSIIKALISSYTSTKVINNKGLHVTINGSAGEGKSDAALTVMKHLPRESVINGHFSDKSLFYMDDLKPRTVILMDDQKLSPELEDSLKASTSDWTKPYPHHTVGKNLEPVTKYIPERCPRWIARVTSEFDEQTADRMLIMKVDESLEQKNHVKALIDKHAMNSSLEEEESEGIKISRLIFGMIPDCKVNIPFAARIKYDMTETSKRSYHILLSLITAFAILNLYQRKIVKTEEKKLDNGQTVKIMTIEANEDDFNAALEIFNESQYNKKLNFEPIQLEFVDFLNAKLESDADGYFFKMLSEMFGEYRGKTCSSASLSQIINGRDDRNAPSLERIPGITTTYGNYSRQKKLLWNREEYRRWKESGSYTVFELVKSEDG